MYRKEYTPIKYISYIYGSMDYLFSGVYRMNRFQGNKKASVLTEA